MNVWVLLNRPIFDVTNEIVEKLILGGSLLQGFFAMIF